MLIAYYYCMPKSVSLDVKIYQFREKMRALVAWSAIMPMFNKQDILHLLDFEKRFGHGAMLSRAKSMIANRDKPDTKIIAAISKKISLVESMRLMQYPLANKKRIKTTNLIAKKHSAKIAGFARTAEPLISSLITLKFMHQVVERWLEFDELKQFVDDPDNLEQRKYFLKLIETRSGQSLQQLLRSVQRQVEDEQVHMWAATLKDSQILKNNPKYAEKYQASLQQGDVAGLAEIYMKGIK